MTTVEELVLALGLERLADLVLALATNVALLSKRVDKLERPFAEYVESLKEEVNAG